VDGSKLHMVTVILQQEQIQAPLATLEWNRPEPSKPRPHVIQVCDQTLDFERV